MASGSARRDLQLETKRLVIPTCVLLALAEILVVGISPILLAYEGRLHLSGLQAGTLVAAASLAGILVPVPAGVVAPHVGVRRITHRSGAFLSVGALAEALPRAFAWVVVARVAIGAAAGVVWVTGVAWLAQAHTWRRSVPGIGITMAGVGLVFGAGVVGLMAEGFGFGARFVLLSLAITVATLVLASAPPTPDRPVQGARLSVDKVLAGAAGGPPMRSALLAISASTIPRGVTSVTLPLELHKDGASTGSIGVLLFTTGFGYIGLSAVVTPCGPGVATLRTATMVTTALGLCLMPGFAQPIGHSTPTDRGAGHANARSAWNFHFNWDPARWETESARAQ
jgi:MFS family permease